LLRISYRSQLPSPGGSYEKVNHRAAHVAGAGSAFIDVDQKADLTLFDPPPPWTLDERSNLSRQEIHLVWEKA